MKTFKVEETHIITDVYYIEADTEEEAKDMYLNGEFDEPDDSFESPDATVGIFVTEDT